jgi:hypothetical protein
MWDSGGLYGAYGNVFALEVSDTIALVSLDCRVGLHDIELPLQQGAAFYSWTTFLATYPSTIP